MSTFSPSSVASSSGYSSFTISSFTQNLASVLSDTRRSKAEVAAFFTRHWGEQFTPQQHLPKAPTVPTISLEHFRHYLDNTAKKHRQYLRARKALRGNVQLFGEQISKDEVPEIFFLSNFLHRDKPIFEAVFLEPRPGEPDNLLSEAEKRRIAGAQSNNNTIRRTESIGSLSSMQSVQSLVPAGEAAHGRMFRQCIRLQNRLEHFDDAVSTLLNQQLEAKSEQFWRTINSYGLLNADLRGAVERTREARERLAIGRRELGERAQRILAVQSARENRQRLLARLHEIACLRDAQTTVQILLSQGDIPRALECIDTAQEVLASDLRGVNCFRHLSNQLDELIIAIGKVLREEFLSMVQREFAWPIKEGAGGGEGGNSKQRCEEDVHRVISSLLHCGEFRFVAILRGEIEEATKNTTRHVVKARLLEHLENNETAIGFGPTNLAEQIGQLSDIQWVQTLRNVLQSLTVLCRRVYSIQCLVVQCAAHQKVDKLPATRAKHPPASVLRTSSPVDILKEEMHSSAAKGSGGPSSVDTTISAPQLVGAAEPTTAPIFRKAQSVEWDGGESENNGNKREQSSHDAENARDSHSFSQTRAQQQPISGSVLGMPCHDISQLRSAAPLLIWHAIQTCEERVAKLMSVRYKDSVLEHCPPSIFHETCKIIDEFAKDWRKIIETEQQQRAYSPNGFSLTNCQRSPIQNIIQQQTIKFINKFSETKRNQFNTVIDSELWRPVTIPSIFQRIIDRFLLNGTLSDVADGGEADMENGDERAEHERDCLVLASGKQFMIVGSATIFLRLLAQYCDLLGLFPHCSMELMMDVVQILKTFNSRACQLILGAGARQLVGLKTISVKHLALASRSLQFIAHFIPTLRQAFSDRLPADRQHLLRHFDQTQRDYADHVNEIGSKLLEMMDRELIGALEEWKLEGKTPSASFRQIVMQIGKFYSSYSAVMPADMTTTILNQIHTNFKLYFRQHLNSRGISPHDSISYGMASQDFAYYVENVRALPQCKSFPNDSIGDVLRPQKQIAPEHMIK